MFNSLLLINSADLSFTRPCRSPGLWSCPSRYQNSLSFLLFFFFKFAFPNCPNHHGEGEKIQFVEKWKIRFWGNSAAAAAGLSRGPRFITPLEAARRAAGYQGQSNASLMRLHETAALVMYQCETRCCSPASRAAQAAARLEVISHDSQRDPEPSRPPGKRPSWTRRVIESFAALRTSISSRPLPPRATLNEKHAHTLIKRMRMHWLDANKSTTVAPTELTNETETIDRVSEGSSSRLFPSPPPIGRSGSLCWLPGLSCCAHRSGSSCRGRKRKEETYQTDAVCVLSRAPFC